MPDLVTLFLDVLTHDFLRYVIGAGGTFLVLNLALARALRYRQIRSTRPGWRQMRSEIAASMRTVLIFACVGTGIVLGEKAGIYPIYTDISDYGWPFFALSLIILIVGHDAWFYWTHFLMHHPRLFRHFHRRHHRSHNPTPFASYSFDASEALVHATYYILIFLVIPAHPLTILIFTAHMMLRNAIGHSGIEIFPAGRDGRPLFGWLTTVTHHDLHHARPGWNFALYFTWWDRWMGTEHPRYIEEFASVARPTRRSPSLLPAVWTALALGVADVADAGDIDGLWATPGLEYVVRIGPCGDDRRARCGTLVFSWDGAATRVPLGRDMLRDIDPESGEGQLIVPDTGRVFRGRIRRAGAETLELKGCAGPLCQRQIWWSVPALRARLSKL